MPCLNEAETLARCIEKAKAFLEEQGIRGEIVVADNGSTDGSPEIALQCGARVVNVAAQGYGNALRGGIEAARGTNLIMGDADDSYDFSSLHPFVERLREGFDLVMGNRFQGGIRPNAMPWLHKKIGNPVLTAIGRILFGAQVRDFHCGLRAFRKDAYERMNLRCGGMEFASEMVIKSTLKNLKIAEVPTILYPDGRSRSSHLRTWRDGWRHLRFMVLFSPLWLFLIPGILLTLIGGSVLLTLAGRSFAVGPVVFDIHTMFLGGFLCLLGYQLIVFAWFTKVFAVREGYHAEPSYFGWLFRWLRLETGLLIGVIMSLAGLVLVGKTGSAWLSVQLGDLDPRVTMRQLVPGAVLLIMGVQTIYSSFFLSILGLDYKDRIRGS
jgi:glycosyltransferase involved in cell wall biosynthesis